MVHYELMNPTHHNLEQTANLQLDTQVFNANCYH